MTLTKSYMATEVELLGFNNKQENQSKNNQGRLTAAEFNQLVDAVNANTTGVHKMTQQIGGLSLSLQDSESAYDSLEVKDDKTIYLILEE